MCPYPVLQPRYLRHGSHRAAGNLGDLAVDLGLGFFDQPDRGARRPDIDPQPTVIDAFVHRVDRPLRRRQRNQPRGDFLLGADVLAAVFDELSEFVGVVAGLVPERRSAAPGNIFRGRRIIPVRGL